jgi:hypothetical protein
MNWGVIVKKQEDVAFSYFWKCQFISASGRGGNWHDFENKEINVYKLLEFWKMFLKQSYPKDTLSWAYIIF